MFNLDSFQKKRKVIYDKYPRFLEKCYISAGEGWFPVIDELCQKIENVYQSLSPEEKAEADKRGSYKGCQIKEKFGGLRFYVDGETLEIHKWIDEAEETCWAICEYCGAEGKRRNSSYWIKTLCDACELQRNK